jgi:hypothetical protein
MPGSEVDDGAPAPDVNPVTSPLALSLVIPAYNEGARLADGVSRLREAVAAGAIDPATTEFIVVDDGSVDDTTAQAESLYAPYPHVRVIRLPENRGKGGAVRAGVAAASAPIIAFADADMAIEPIQTPLFVHALRDAELAIGSRAATGAEVDRASFRRSMMNRVFNQLVNALTGVALDDTQCGFKAFRAPTAKLLFHCSVTERFAFDVEVLSLARRLGLPIAEVPVHWLRVKGSQIRPWTDARSMIRDVVRAGRGARSTPPVPTLLLTWPPGQPPGADASWSLQALRMELAPGLPVLQDADGTLRVLCPLMSEAEIAATAAALVARAAGPTLTRTAMSVAELSAMAPLALGPDQRAAESAVERVRRS